MPDETLNEPLPSFSDIGLSPTAGLDSGGGAAADPSPSNTPNESAARDSAPQIGSTDQIEGDSNQAPQAGAGAAQAVANAPAGAGQNSRTPKLAQIKDPKLANALKFSSNATFEEFFPIALKLQNGDLVDKAKVAEQLAAKENELKAASEAARAARYFDHEEGYKLTPEYVEVANHVAGLSQEQETWIEQAAAVEQGKPFYFLQKGPDGKPQWAGPYNPAEHPGISARIQAKISQATAMIQNLSGKLHSLPEQHRSKYNELNTNLTKMDTELFGNVKNPEFHSLHATYLKSFPGFMRGRPEIVLLAKALAGGQLFMRQNQQLREELGKKGAFKAATGASAPNPNSSGTSGPPDPSDSKALVAQLHAMASR